MLFPHCMRSLLSSLSQQKKDDEAQSPAWYLSRGPLDILYAHLNIGVWGTQVCVGQSWNVLQLQQQGCVF